jgi:hypothetical protein
MEKDALDAYVKAIVDKAPPLTAAQKDKLRALLRPALDDVLAREKKP